MEKVPILCKDGTTEDIQVYSPDEIVRGCVHLPVRTSRRSQKYHCTYVNVPVTFDIETSHISDNDDTYTFMYHWQVAIGEIVIFGRTWDTFIDLVQHLVEYWSVCKEHRLIIFVHNLSYEFQFIKFRLPFVKVFARENNKPITAELGGDFTGVEFRDTFSISGYSLATLAKNTPSCRWCKDKTDLDYNIIRTASTQLTPREKGYCAKDVLIPSVYIQQLITQEHSKIIGDIPITKTGFVRRSCRNHVKDDKEWRHYRDEQLLDAEQFIQYVRAFRGGDTHCNAPYNNEIIEDVYSFDLTSSYPYRFLIEEYPLSKPITLHRPNVDTLNWLDGKGYLYIIDVVITGVQLKSVCHFDYIPVAKCTNSIEPKIDNGRIVSASMIRCTVTSLDFEIMRDNYDFTIADIHLIIYHVRKGLLPRSFRDFIIERYRLKTKLKGVPDMALEYQKSKEEINSAYGMAVTNPLNDTVEMDFETGEWTTARMIIDYPNIGRIDDELQKAYKSPKNFLPYEMGVWTTAFARYDLHTVLRHDRIGSDAVYWDTDSAKFIGEYNRQIFADLNAEKEKRLMAAGYALDDIAPMDIKGKRHMIGLWDEDYAEPVTFWSIGAKKYAYREKDGNEHVTVAGLNGAMFADYCKSVGRSVLDIQIGETVSAEHSGRTLSEYINEPFEMVINGERVGELSYQNIIPTTYTFGVTGDLAMYSLLAKQQIKER